MASQKLHQNSATTRWDSTQQSTINKQHAAMHQNATCHSLTRYHRSTQAQLSAIILEGLGKFGRPRLAATAALLKIF
eukprot:968288-Alexandrium_andersonii.AAC.1